MGTFKRLWLTLAAATAILWPASIAAEIVPVARFVQVLGNSRSASGVELANAAARSQQVLMRVSAAYGMSAPEYYVETNASLNAYVRMQDGRPVMVISTEMLRLAGESDDLLAVVIAHELGHLKADHLNKGASTQLFVGLVGAVLGAAIDARQARRGVDTHGLGRTLGNVGAGLAIAKFSRDDEREADALGLKAMAAAGFDPQAAPRLWRRMANASNGGSGQWLSSHPSHAEREQTLAALSVTTPGAPRQAAAGAEPPLAPDPFPTSAAVSLAPTAADVTGQTPYLRGGMAISQQRFSNGISLMKEAAEAGDERAMYVLGVLYAEGDQNAGVRADAAQAKGWLERATQKGFTQAISYLGMKKFSQDAAYSGGHDGVSLLRWADLRGDATASSALGFAYLLGGGVVPRDEALAAKYAKAGMERGNVGGKALYATLQVLRAKSTDEAEAGLQTLRDTAECDQPV